MSRDSEIPGARATAERPWATSRRSFLKGVGLAAGAAAVLPGIGSAAEPAATAASADVDYTGDGQRQITLMVNGAPAVVAVEPRTTLLEALRTGLDLTGAKEVCDRGSCGCCTVLLDGRAVVSCLMLAVDAVGREIVTVEGIAADPKYKNLIDGLCEHDAAQCGFCIPGFVVRSAEFLKSTPNPTPDDIRAGLAGNVCRCGTYSKLFDGVAAAAAKGGVK